MDPSELKLTLLLFVSPKWRVRLYAYDEDWHMYRYPEPDDRVYAQSLARSLLTAPFARFPEQRAKDTQIICEELRGKPVMRDVDSEEKLSRLNLTLKLSGIHHIYVLPSPRAVHHLGLPYVELDDGFRAYPVGELVPRKEPRESKELV